MRSALVLSLFSILTPPWTTASLYTRSLSGSSSLSIEVEENEKDKHNNIEPEFIGPKCTTDWECVQRAVCTKNQVSQCEDTTCQCIDIIRPKPVIEYQDFENPKYPSRSIDSYYSPKPREYPIVYHERYPVGMRQGYPVEIGDPRVQDMIEYGRPYPPPRSQFPRIPVYYPYRFDYEVIRPLK